MPEGCGNGANNGSVTGTTLDNKVHKDDSNSPVAMTTTLGQGHQDKDSDQTYSSRSSHAERKSESSSTRMSSASENSDQPTDDNSGFPVDQGWAWVILAAALFEIFIYGGIMKSYGIFFLEYQKRFKSSASATSLMSSIQNLAVCIPALFVMTILLKKISCRTSVMAGAVIHSASYIITAFATDIRVAYFSFGLLAGVATAMMYFPVMDCISRYFQKHRGLANSIMMSGTSLGNLIFAPIIARLFDEYGYTGAILITSGIFLNIAVSGALLRPSEFFTRRGNGELVQGELENNEIKKEASVFKSDTDQKDQIKDLETIESSLASQGHSNRFKEEENKPFIPRHEDPHLDIVRRQTPTGTIHDPSNGLPKVLKPLSLSRTALYASADVIYGSMIDLQIDRKTTRDTNAVSEKHNCFGRCFSFAWKYVKSIFDKDSLMRTPVFLVVLGMGFALFPGLIMITIFAAPYADEIGIPTNNIALLYTVLGAIDLFARISVGFINDRKWVRHTTIIAVASIVIGTAAHLLRFFTTFAAMVVFAVLMGLCCGTYLALFGTLLVDYMGIKKFKSALGIASVAHGVATAIMYPLTGLLKDISGTYVATFHFLGTVLYVGAGLALVLPVLKRWQDKKREIAQEECNDSENN